MLQANILTTPSEEAVKSITVDIVYNSEPIARKMMQFDYSLLTEEEKKVIDDFTNLIISKQE